MLCTGTRRRVKCIIFITNTKCEEISNYEETNTQHHAKSPCFEKIPNTSILVRIGIRRLIHSLYHKIENAAGRVVGRRRSEASTAARRAPAETPGAGAHLPPTGTRHAPKTRQSRQAKLRRAIERTPPSSRYPDRSLLVNGTNTKRCPHGRQTA